LSVNLLLPIVLSVILLLAIVLSVILLLAIVFFAHWYIHASGYS
jgi:hypothetical protein